jgi:uncharacterized protein YecE (DUF72 family)
MTMAADALPAPALIGTAGWSIPKVLGGQLVGNGTHLERYAARLRVAEINSSFYRPHRPSTYERWAASVPPHFRFSIKLPKAMTHQHKLVDCGELLATFAGQTAGLGDRRGPALVQLPPSLSFDADVASVFFDTAIRHLGASIACEPRHASWFEDDADCLLRDLGVARVAADPAICAAAAKPGGWPGLVYYRLHGSPSIYRSPYDQEALERQRVLVIEAHERGAECWTIFDNTASGAALANALELSSAFEPEFSTKPVRLGEAGGT